MEFLPKEFLKKEIDIEYPPPKTITLKERIKRRKRKKQAHKQKIKRSK